MIANATLIHGLNGAWDVAIAKAETARSKSGIYQLAATETTNERNRDNENLPDTNRQTWCDTLALSADDMDETACYGMDLLPADCRYNSDNLAHRRESNRAG